MRPLSGLLTNMTWAAPRKTQSSNWSKKNCSRRQRKKMTLSYICLDIFVLRGTLLVPCECHRHVSWSLSQLTLGGRPVTPWTGPQSIAKYIMTITIIHNHIHTLRQFRTFNQPHLHVSGMWVEAGVPGGSPCKRRENRRGNHWSWKQRSEWKFGEHQKEAWVSMLKCLRELPKNVWLWGQEIQIMLATWSNTETCGSSIAMAMLDHLHQWSIRFRWTSGCKTKWYIPGGNIW